MYKIVIMNGKPCSGKTTFEELCGIFCTTYLYSTIDPIKEAAKKCKVSHNNISKCCKGKQNYAGKLKDGTKLQWKYAEDDDNESKAV